MIRHASGKKMGKKKPYIVWAKVTIISSHLQKKTKRRRYEIKEFIVGRHGYHERFTHILFKDVR